MRAPSTSLPRRAAWRPLRAWRRRPLARWSLLWSLAGAILGCSAIPDGVTDELLPGASGTPLSKGLPLPAPSSPEDDAVAVAQPLPEPGALFLAVVFLAEDACLPEEPAWVPHLRPAMPDVLGIAPKTGPPPATLPS